MRPLPPRPMPDPAAPDGDPRRRTPTPPPRPPRAPTGIRLLACALAVLAPVLAPGRAHGQPADLATGATVAGAVPPTNDRVKPFGATGVFVNRLDATFGARRRDATVRDKRGLDRIAYYRFIYGDATTTGNGTDGLYGNYRSRHRDYTGGDPRSLHVFTADGLTLKAHCGLETADRSDCSDGNIESGILRFALPIRPGSYIEIRCKMPAAMYAWPAFWLNPGEQAPSAPGGKPRRSVLNWPPEIDIFDQFGFNGVEPGHYLITGTPTNKNDAAYGNPRDLYRDPAWGDKWYYQTAQDLTRDYNVYALDWGKDNVLKFILNGKVFRERYYEWNSKGDVAAHLIASLQIGPKFNDLSKIADQGGKPNGWDWPLDYIRVWERVR